jgi:hypothetical protein
MASMNVALAQDFRKYYSIVFDANKPLSNKEYIDNISTRGAKFVYREFINERFTMGGELGFATYNDHLPPGVYGSNPAVYAEVFSYVYNYTLTLSGEYYFVKNRWILPYAGLGLGVSYSRIDAYYNIFQDEEKKWGALIRPNAGVLMRFGKTSRWGASIGLHLDYSTIKSENFDYKNFSNLGLQAGLFVMIR